MHRYWMASNYLAVGQVSLNISQGVFEETTLFTHNTVLDNHRFICSTEIHCFANLLLSRTLRRSYLVTSERLQDRYVLPVLLLSSLCCYFHHCAVTFIIYELFPLLRPELGSHLCIALILTFKTELYLRAS
jgi:hypothetical protein